MVNGSIILVELSSESTAFVGNQLYIRGIISSTQCQLSVQELNQQPIIAMEIGNAEHPATPSGQINQKQISDQVVQLSFEPKNGCGYRECICEWILNDSMLFTAFQQLNQCSALLNISLLARVCDARSNRYYTRIFSVLASSNESVQFY
jgi:hypothetical protein